MTSTKISPSDESGPLRVLVIDEDEDVRRALARALALDGHATTAVGSPREALAQRRRFDVAIVDLVLPDDAALAAAGRFLTAGLVGRVVFFTSVRDATTLAAARELGHVIHKDLHALREHLRVSALER
jgi:two-component system, OmpR family, phosphate regulon response regulator OmpR